MGGFHSATFSTRDPDSISSWKMDGWLMYSPVTPSSVSGSKTEGWSTSGLGAGLHRTWQTSRGGRAVRCAVGSAEQTHRDRGEGEEEGPAWSEAGGRWSSRLAGPLAFHGAGPPRPMQELLITTGAE